MYQYFNILVCVERDVSVLFLILLVIVLNMQLRNCSQKSVFGITLIYLSSGLCFLFFVFLRHQPGWRTQTTSVKNHQTLSWRHVQVGLSDTYTNNVTAVKL